MILKALKVCCVASGVQVMVLKDVHVPLMTVVESGRFPMDSNGFPIERADLQMDTLNVTVRTKSDVFPTVPMRFETISKTDFGRPGILVGTNQGTAIEYIVRHWVCGGYPVVDAAVTAAREARDRGEPFQHLVSQFATPPARRRGWHDEDEVPDGFVWSRDQFDGAFSRVGGRGAATYTIDRHRGESVMAAILVKRKGGSGGPVPGGWDVMAFGDERDNRIVTVSTSEGWQSGPLRRIDEDTLSRFEKRGRMVAIGQVDLTAWQSWVAVAVVKVPSTTSRMGTDDEPDILREFPVARLADARLPLAFSGDVKVVSDPGEALDILCRSTRGYVLAGLGGDVLPPSFRRLSGHWLAICVPAPWVSGSRRPGRCRGTSLEEGDEALRVSLHDCDAGAA